MRRLRDDHLQPLLAHLGGEALGSLPAAAAGDHPANWELRAQGGKIAARLQAAGDEAQCFRLRPREAFGRDGAESRRPLAPQTDPVHHRDGQAGPGLVDHDQGMEIRCPARRVAGEIAKPFDRGIAGVVQHVGLRAKTGTIGLENGKLGPGARTARGLGRKRCLDSIVHVARRDRTNLNIGAAEIEQFPPDIELSRRVHPGAPFSTVQPMIRRPGRRPQTKSACAGH